jgi:type IV secretion system protein VirB4
MKEAITETRPLALDALLKIPANFRVITEWTPLAADKARKEVNKRRRHFNMSKTGLSRLLAGKLIPVNAWLFPQGKVPFSS